VYDRRTFLALAGTMAIGLLPDPIGAQTTKLSVGVPPSDGVKAFLWAAHAGIFRKYGLDVDTVPMSSGSAAMSAVAGGTMHVAFVNVPSVVSAYAHGARFVFVAPGGIYASERPYELLFTKKDGPIKGARDFNGKTISSPALRDLTSLSTLAWIDQNGGDSKAVHAIELPASLALSALDDGRIDAVELASPFLDNAVASGKYRVLGKPFDAIAKHFVVSGWVAAADAADKAPDLFMRFGRAMHEAILYSNAHLPETVDLVAQYTKIDSQLIAHGTRVLDAEYLSGADIQPIVDFSVKYGVISKAFDAADLIGAPARRPAAAIK
jgi:NitT/TauT family transport system substrate-binding protein